MMDKAQDEILVSQHMVKDLIIVLLCASYFLSFMALFLYIKISKIMFAF